MKRLVLLLIFIFCISFVFAENIVIEFDESKDVSNIIFFKYNDYYAQNFYFGLSEDFNPESLGVSLVNLDSEKVIYPKAAYGARVIFNNLNLENQYELRVGSKKTSIESCNQNSICDGYENYLSCPSDCSTGEKDGYCNLEPDLVCDEDCPEYDFDCETCSYCVYENMYVPKDYCDQLGGNGCSVEMGCDGYFTYSSDYGSYCCIGNCFNPSLKFVESLSESRDENYDGDEDSQSDLSYLEEQAAKPFNITIFINVLLIIVSLLVAVIFVAVFESKAIKREHEVRSYVYSLFKQGYSYNQIYTALVNQNIEKNIVEKVMRNFR